MKVESYSKRCLVAVGRTAPLEEEHLMYGWRARIGVIVSPPNTVAEVELGRMAPEGVSVHATRMYRPREVTGLDQRTLEVTNSSLPQAAGAIAPLKPDVLVFAHTMGSIVGGPGRDHGLVSMLAEAAGCHAITTAGAAMAAFGALGLGKLVIAGPYTEDDLLLMEKDYFEASMEGLEILGHESLGITNGWDIGQLEPREFFRLAKEADRPDAEAVFISGTNGRTIEVLEALEQDLGKPVLSANQVTMWAALHYLGIGGVKGYGSLFEHQ